MTNLRYMFVTGVLNGGMLPVRRAGGGAPILLLTPLCVLCMQLHVDPITNSLFAIMERHLELAHARKVAQVPDWSLGLLDRKGRVTLWLMARAACRCTSGLC